MLLIKNEKQPQQLTASHKKIQSDTGFELIKLLKHRIYCIIKGLNFAKYLETCRYPDRLHNSSLKKFHALLRVRH